jgi:anti-sigma factor RsiW
MTCREFAEFLADYLANELPSDVEASFERHMRNCPNCRRYLASYRETVALGRKAFDDESASVPTDVPEGLVQAILQARNRPGSK